MGREAVPSSDKSELYTTASFPTGPTSTGHSVLIHRGGCRHVAGIKLIRVHTDIRTGKADGKDGRSGTACRSVYEIAGSLADGLRKASGGEDESLHTPLVHSTLCNDQNRNIISHISQERRGRVTFDHQVIPYHTSTENVGSSQHTPSSSESTT